MIESTLGRLGVAWAAAPIYISYMVDLKFEAPVIEEIEVDSETLAAIDKGLEDVEAGRIVSIEEVRDKVRRWTSSSRSLNQR